MAYEEFHFTQNPRAFDGVIVTPDGEIQLPKLWIGGKAEKGTPIKFLIDTETGNVAVDIVNESRIKLLIDKNRLYFCCRKFTQMLKIDKRLHVEIVASSNTRLEFGPFPQIMVKRQSYINSALPVADCTAADVPNLPVGMEELRTDIDTVTASQSHPVSENHPLPTGKRRGRPPMYLGNGQFTEYKPKAATRAAIVVDPVIEEKQAELTVEEKWEAVKARLLSKENIQRTENAISLADRRGRSVAMLKGAGLVIATKEILAYGEVEYQISPTRTDEAYWVFGPDDNFTCPITTITAADLEEANPRRKGAY